MIQRSAKLYCHRVTGVGIEMKGLVPDSLYGNTKYLNPVEKLNEITYTLKKKESCDMIIWVAAVQ